MFRKFLVAGWILYFSAITLVFVFPRRIGITIGATTIHYYPVVLLLLTVAHIVYHVYKTGMRRDEGRREVFRHR